MSRPDDFEIVDEEEETGWGSGRRLWPWILAFAFMVLFIGLVGLAYTQIVRRLGPSPAPASTVTLVTATAIPTVPALTSPSPSAQPTAPGVSPTQSATPSPAVTPTAVTCREAVEARFAALYSRERLGCPRSGLHVEWAAWQRFERGSMLWRNDTNRVYVFYQDGSWQPVDEHWNGRTVPLRAAPPPGLQAPIRGFGYIWGLRDDVFAGLGWAVEAEKGFCAAIQDFEGGFILASSPVPSCTADQLYNHATAPDWVPIELVATVDGRWREATGENSLAAPPEATRPIARPAGHGVFPAEPLAAVVLDGQFNEWSTPQFPITAVVHGADRYGGPMDLAGTFQVAWSEQGLYLGVRVVDDQYRSGPAGTDMWQGDGLEIHLDRELLADFSNPQADGDDYQIGVSFGPGLDQIRAYRWLPLDQEGPLEIPGAVAVTGQGYQVELLIPWYVFGLGDPPPAGGSRFGFNVSINDNDGDQPAQETVASASPRRTTHDNPTEWGTLLLRP